MQDRRPWFLGERETGDSEGGPDGGSEWDGTVQAVAEVQVERDPDRYEMEPVEVAQFDLEEDAHYAVVARNACVQLGLTEDDLSGGALVRLVAGEEVARQAFLRIYTTAIAGLADAALIADQQYGMVHVVSVVEQLAEFARGLREDNARLRAALQPFAKCAGYLSGRVAVVELSDCRRAAEALAPPKEAPDAP
jgi:hypothetical protein